jgi:hypothetical protein
MRVRIIAMLFMSFLVVSSNLWGWGAGHDDVQNLINENLPAAIKSRFTPEQLKKLVKHYSHYPDDFSKFDKDEVGEYALEILKEFDVDKRYDLHKVKGRTAAFKLLVETFKRKDYDRSIIWMGALGHALADEAASNHDPIIHFTTYHLWNYNLDTGKDIKLKKFSKWLDIHGTARDPEGKKVFYASMEDYQPKIISESPEETIIDLNVKADCIFPNLMGQQGSKILRGIKNGEIDNDPVFRKKLFSIMTELGSVSAAYTIDLIYTADAYATQGKNIVFNKKAVFKTIHDKEREYVKNKPLNCGVYRENFKFDQKKPKLGIIIEPFYSFNNGQISALWKYVAPALARKLTEKNIAYQVVDLRNMIKNGLPSPDKLPVCIFSSGGYNGYIGLEKKKMDKAFSDYINKGGKLIWIGGLNISKALEMDKYLEKVGGKIDGKYYNYSGVANDEIAKCKLEITKDFSPKLAREYPFVNNPVTKAGWCKPPCRFILKKYDTLYMILDYKGKKIPVAGKFGNIIFIPEYAISPYLFDNKYNLKEMDRPSLDQFSANLLLTAIDKFIKK